MWGQIFFPFVFRFLTYLLSCILFLFALRYFVNYAPLLRAVCKFRYSLLSRPFFSPGYVSISVTALVEVDFFPRWPWPPTLSSSAFGKQLRFHRFLLISFCSRLKVVFLYCNYCFFALCRNLCCRALKTYWSNIYRTFIEFQYIFKIGEISPVTLPHPFESPDSNTTKESICVSKACGNNHLVNLPGELININHDHYNWVVRQTTA